MLQKRALRNNSLKVLSNHNITSSFPILPYHSKAFTDARMSTHRLTILNWRTWFWDFGSIKCPHPLFRDCSSKRMLAFTFYALNSCQVRQTCIYQTVASNEASDNFCGVLAAFGESKLIRFSSTTSGRFISRVFIAMMYSPKKPRKQSCTPPIKNTAIIVGA